MKKEMKMCKCDKCGKASKSVAYDEEYGESLCAECFNDFEFGMEEHEILKRERIAEDNEY